MAMFIFIPVNRVMKPKTLFQSTDYPQGKYQQSKSQARVINQFKLYFPHMVENIRRACNDNVCVL